MRGTIEKRSALWQFQGETSFNGQEQFLRSHSHTLDFWKWGAEDLNVQFVRESVKLVFGGDVQKRIGNDITVPLLKTEFIIPDNRPSYLVTPNIPWSINYPITDNSRVNNFCSAIKHVLRSSFPRASSPLVVIQLFTDNLPESPPSHVPSHSDQNPPSERGQRIKFSPDKNCADSEHASDSEETTLWVKDLRSP